MKINTPFFCIAAYPNVFKFEEELDLQAIANYETDIDFTLPAELTDEHLRHWDERVIDETHECIADKTVLDEVKLRAFYEANGFTQCEQLMFHYPVKEDRICRELCVSQRTFCRMHKRPMIFPDNRKQIKVVDDLFRSCSRIEYSEFDGKRLLNDILTAASE